MMFSKFHISYDELSRLQRIVSVEQGVAKPKKRRSGHQRAELAGRRFGILTVIEFAKRESLHKPHSYWLCRCDCGVEWVARAGAIQSGNTKSCGCLRQQSSRSRVKSLGRDLAGHFVSNSMQQQF